MSPVPLERDVHRVAGITALDDRDCIDRDKERQKNKTHNPNDEKLTSEADKDKYYLVPYRPNTSAW